MALFGSLSTLQHQLADAPRFASTYAYLAELLTPGSPARNRLDKIEVGKSEKVDLGGGVFAMEQVYMTKPSSDVVWESHRAYIDVQVVVVGDEYLEVNDVGALVVSEDHTPGKDVLFYRPSAPTSKLRLGPGGCAVFFPVDGHRPSMVVAEPLLVRKTVVKVPVA
ncbi:MAG TPA: YhcH/YjgK/YiaL family protein [Opitutaceae bacterium]|nr:YhcH/YjgK/YiaL family protein [Opitutaceae bacterium]